MSLTKPDLLGNSGGILLLGRDLASSSTIDSFVNSILVNGLSIPNLLALFECLDSAAKREKRRIPFVIDGLNEAEDPRKWKVMGLSIILCH